MKNERSQEEREHEKTSKQKKPFSSNYFFLFFNIPLISTLVFLLRRYFDVMGCKSGGMNDGVEAGGELRRNVLLSTLSLSLCHRRSL